jgi:hypothetical protein
MRVWPSARTFVETQAMNERYREAEAVLIADPPNLAF